MPALIIVYPLAAMYVLSSYNVGVLNNSQLVHVVLIGRLVTEKMVRVKTVRLDQFWIKNGPAGPFLAD